MVLLPLMVPEGSQERSRQRFKRRIYYSKVTNCFPCFKIIYKTFQGRNLIWYCDGYDKLKPFGITIYGCIDGYVADIHDSFIF